MANYKQLPNSKISFTVNLEKGPLEKAQKQVLQSLKSEVSIKGFRKGQAPDEMVLATLGPQRVGEEALNRALDKLFWDFIETEKIRVVSRPEVDLPETQDWPMKVGFKVEVYPEIKLGDYSKIKVKREEPKVTEDDIAEVLQTLCAQMQLSHPVDRAAQDRDMLTVDFVAKDKKGEVLPNTEGKGQVFRVGMGHFLEDLEKAFVGMKAGESKDKVKVKFPKTYHAKEMAGQTILFDIVLHKVEAIDPSKLTEDQIEQLSGQKMKLPAFKEQIKQTITQNKSKEADQKAIQSYEEALLKLVTAELPQSWIDEEVNNRWNQMTQNPQYLANPEGFWAQLGKTEAQFRKDIGVEAGKSLKVFLGLTKIIETENIELDKDEMNEVNILVEAQAAQNPQTNKDILRDKIILNRKIDKHLRAQVLSA